MERQQVTLETIREKYYHSDTQYRYWRMQKQGCQKDFKYVLWGMISISILIALFYFTVYVLDNPNVEVGFLFLVLFPSLYSIIHYHNHIDKKRDLCEHATLSWMFINRGYKELYDRVMEGDVVYQDKIKKIEQDEKDLSIQVVSITTDSRKLHKAEDETQKFFNLLTNPS